jgi:phosphoribosyl-AMP cyclohydrolase
VLLLDDKTGVACHPGRRSRFYRAARGDGLVTLAEPLVSPDALYGRAP